VATFAARISPPKFARWKQGFAAQFDRPKLAPPNLEKRARLFGDSEKTLAVTSRIVVRKRIACQFRTTDWSRHN